MKIRKEVQELIDLGPMPTEEMVDPETVKKYEVLIHKIHPPLSTSEAEELIKLFGNDSFYGLVWTLVDLIESIPNWPETLKLPAYDNEWVQLLRERARRRSDTEKNNY